MKKLIPVLLLLATAASCQIITGNVLVSGGFNQPPGVATAPETYSARTDLSESLNFTGVQTPPAVGGLNGAGNCITDPDFHSQICRLTDYTFNALGSTFDLGSQGKLNRWAVDHSKLLVNNGGGGFLVFKFNDVNNVMTLTSSSLHGQSVFPGANYGMSSLDPNTLFEITLGASNVTINKIVINNPQADPSQWTITRTKIVNFFDTPGCLPADFVPNWTGGFVPSNDDKSFAVSLGDNGQNGLPGNGKYGASFTVAYRQGKGVRCIATETGTVTGSYGPFGTWDIPDGFNLHESGTLSDPNLAAIGPGTCSAGHTCTCQDQGLNHCDTYYWQIDTLHVAPCSPPSCQGHASGGYVNDYRAKWYTAHNYYNPSLPGEGAKSLPVSLGSFDNHGSYNNAGNQDHAPIFAFTTYVCGQPNNPGARPCLVPYPQAFGDEVIGVENAIANPLRADCNYGAGPVGCVYRFAHNFNSGKNWKFAAQNGLGNVSPDGLYAVFVSDWMEGLGCTNGTNSPCMDSTLADPATTCKAALLSTNNCARSDLFVIKLQTAHP